MPKKGFEICKEIHAEMLSKFPKGKIPKRELEKIIGLTAGIDDRTISKYIGWLFDFYFIKIAKDSEGKVMKNQYDEIIYEILNQSYQKE